MIVCGDHRRGASLATMLCLTSSHKKTNQVMRIGESNGPHPRSQAALSRICTAYGRTVVVVSIMNNGGYDSIHTALRELSCSRRADDCWPLAPALTAWCVT